MNRPATTASSDTMRLILLAGLAAFITYVSMYAFRRPFTVATFEGVTSPVSGLDFKTTLLIAQVAGYALSKFIGIKVVSEMQPEKRKLTLIGLILLAWLALGCLPLLPAQLKFMALFANGLPLGMVWGLVFSFLEGRKITEAAGAILCVTFVLGSGLVKTVGSWLLINTGVGEMWMPFVTGGLFLPPFLAGIYLLGTLPAPSTEDIALRQARIPLDGTARWQFFRDYSVGLSVLIISYMLLTALRDFSDNFAAEIWTALGYGDTPEIFLLTSIPVTLLILIMLGSLMKIRNNATALMVNHLIIGVGFITVLLGTWLFDRGYIEGVFWFVAITVGLYMSYVPFNCILFERLIAATRSLGNAGFLIYLADSFGYLGTVSILLYKSAFQPELSWVSFTLHGSYVIGGLGLALTLVAMAYFHRQLDVERSGADSPVAQAI